MVKSTRRTNNKNAVSARKLILGYGHFYYYDPANDEFYQKSFTFSMINRGTWNGNCMAISEALEARGFSYVSGMSMTEVTPLDFVRFVAKGTMNIQEDPTNVTFNITINK